MDRLESAKLVPGDKIVTKTGNVFRFVMEVYSGANGGQPLIIYGNDVDNFYRPIEEIEKYVPPAPVFEVGKKYRYKSSSRLTTTFQIEHVGKWAYGYGLSGGYYVVNPDERAAYEEVQ